MRRCASWLPEAARSLLLVLAAALPTLAAAADPGLKDAWSEALKTKDLERIDSLLDDGADPAWVAEGDRTALMFAAEGRDLALLEKLIGAGARVDARNQYRGTALMFAAKGGDVEVTRHLISAGAQVNAVADLAWTALLLAAAKGNADVVELLIEQGAGPNAQDKNGWTPLMHAVYGRHRRTVVTLLAHETVEPDLREESGSTALHIAALTGDEAITRELIDHGADVSVRSGRGYTPAEVAAESRHPELAQLLQNVARGATPKPVPAPGS